MLEAELAAETDEAVGFITGAGVGEQTAYADAEPFHTSPQPQPESGSRCARSGLDTLGTTPYGSVDGLKALREA